MNHFLDIVGDDVALLGDVALREVVARLCESELSRRGLPTTAVIWGGHQNAADGGIDVAVELPPTSVVDGFVPRPMTGLQVKLPDMAPSDIKEEMRPEGVLRGEILDLCNRGGAYVIASGHATVTKIKLRNRILAMKECVADAPNGPLLHVDFYDRVRIATAIRDNPAIIPWVRERIGKPSRGWHALGSWPGASPLSSEYIVDGAARLSVTT
ncbi:MAG: hypothetical protein ABI433_15565 [Burkholderiaceae bacterium]